MKIAFLHLSYCGNDQKKNELKILKGMDIASEYGAKWVLTPEMALQGYHMMREDKSFQLVSLNNGLLRPFMDKAKKNEQRLFLGCGFVHDRIPRNALLTVNPDGTFYNQHSKVKVVKWITEQWAHPGESFNVWELDGIRTSVMVCADLYFPEHGAIIAEQKAELIIGVACWPEGGHAGPPHVAWERMSAAAGNIPLLICNQTGNLGMDLNSARSAVVDNGKMLFHHNDKEAVLIIDYDEKNKKIACKDFQMIAFDSI